MGRRKKPRFKMVLPFRLAVNDADGRPLQLLAYTLDISAGGARLAGIRVPLNIGDTLHGQYKQAKARFRVVWVGEPGEKGDRQVGIQYLAGEKSIWVELPEEDFCDEVEVLDTEVAEPAAAGLSEPAEAPSQDPLGELINTLEAVLEKLRETAGLVHSAGLVPEIAEPFKTAIAHARNTGFAVQQWIELQQDSKDTSVALETANSERVRFAAQLCRSLIAQVEQLGPGISGEARTALIAAVRNLAQHLGLQHTGERPPQSSVRPARQQCDPVALLAGLNEEIRSSKFQVAELLNLIAERACLFTSADGAAIAVRDDTEMVCCASAGMAPLVGIRFSASEALAGTAIRTARPVVWSDTQKDSSVDAALCASLNVRSSVIVPITAGAEVVGALQAFSALPDTFDDTSVLLLQRLAEFVASVATGLPSVANSAG